MTILMIVGNTMVMAMRERTREIGVLKALGFSGRAFCAWCWAKSIALALIGGLPGLAIASRSARQLRVSLSAFVPGPGGDAGYFVIGIVLMIVLGVLTGLAPALNAMRLKTAVALGGG